MKTRLAICAGESALWGVAGWHFFGLTFGIVAFAASFFVTLLAMALCAVAGAGEGN